MKLLISLFSPNYPRTLVYMLQSTEYAVEPYLKWFWRVEDFSTVMYRRTLKKTRAANLLLMTLSLGMIVQIATGLMFVVMCYQTGSTLNTLLGAMLVVSYPVTWAYLIVIPLVLGRIFIVNPANRRRITSAREIFKNHTATKIAVAGSYGKTTMKELLNTVLSEGLNVAATPANKNVASSHAIFASRLTGKEDVLIIEYGEGAPGDVARFAHNTTPDWGIITGLAPAHLDHYPSLKAAGEDIFSLTTAVGAENVYVNKESDATKPFIKSNFNTYSSQEALGWKVSQIKVGFKGTSFTLTSGIKKMHLKSGIIGRHQVGPLALVAALGDKLGLSQKQIEEGVSKTKSFEHRMQARELRGAWILDDTYNGNIDGMKAGLRLLEELPGKRKIYITPGLVDQGVEEQRVHYDLGKSIAKCNPDKVVLMNNSVTEHIRSGLAEGNYKGELVIEDDPLDFYVNLEHFVAAGDVVLMQNDWPDNYN